MIVCAGKSETFDFAVPMGIGLMEVAINLTEVCIQQKPEFLLFVGSAGSYGRKKVFEIIESVAACNLENSYLEGRSYTPLQSLIISSYDSTDATCLNMNVSRETIVNSSNYITSDTRYAKAYLEQKVDLENMEFYAVLKVAKKFNLSAKGLFIVTNYCDENAHEEFLKNHQEAMKKLTQYVKEMREEYSDAN